MICMHVGKVHLLVGFRCRKVVETKCDAIKRNECEVKDVTFSVFHLNVLLIKRATIC